MQPKYITAEVFSVSPFVADSNIYGMNNRSMHLGAVTANPWSQPTISSLSIYVVLILLL